MAHRFLSSAVESCELLNWETAASKLEAFSGGFVSMRITSTPAGSLKGIFCLCLLCLFLAATLFMAQPPSAGHPPAIRRPSYL